MHAGIRQGLAGLVFVCILTTNKPLHHCRSSGVLCNIGLTASTPPLSITTEQGALRRGGGLAGPAAGLGEGGVQHFKR